jgi:cytochrome c peroxidase
MPTIFAPDIERRRTPRACSVLALVLPLGLWTADAEALDALQELGKNVFFDTKMSVPANKQACVSCHDPAWGWTLPNSKINATTVVAPGAKPHALGSIKTPTNAYAFFAPPFKFSPAPFVPPWVGGNFWDGRAEGCGATSGPCPAAIPVGPAISETIKLADLPPSKQGAQYLGPTADQALNPFPNAVEQDIREKNVCQVVKTAKYKGLYEQAYGVPIDCSPNPKANPAYRTSFKRIAVAIAAWQGSPEVNPFSSKRDKAIIAAGSTPKFPLAGLDEHENRGHDLFYGAGRCSACHNGVPQDEGADPTGVKLRQLYTDSRYHNIGVPFNREIPGVARLEKAGLVAHVTNVAPGEFKTPTVRNVDRRPNPGSTKAYTHNGWFKSLESLVHFYNTRDALGPSCDKLGFANATEKEAKDHNCWPESEFANPAAGVIGNLKLSPDDEADIVSYLKALTDDSKDIPTPP